MITVHAWWVLRGFLLGLAMVVPGLSGGTVAMAGGFYRALVCVLAHPRLARIAPLAAGTVAGAVGGGRAIGIALDTAPDQLGALLAGVVVAASLLILPRAVGSPVLGLWFAAGAAGGWTIAGMDLASAVGGIGPLPAMLAGGLLSSAAMVLPGISGASMLVMVGQYELALDALARWDLPLLTAFILGAATGLLTVSRVMMTALQRGPAAILLLGGMMLGSARGLWPSRMDPGVILFLIAGAAAMVIMKGGWGQWKGWTRRPPGGVSRS